MTELTKKLEALGATDGLTPELRTQLRESARKIAKVLETKKDADSAPADP